MLNFSDNTILFWGCLSLLKLPCIYQNATVYLCYVSGPLIKHKYMSPGTRNVYVTAHNHVYSETIQIKAYINHDIQSVEVVPEFDVVSMKEIVRFSVVIKPNMTATYYWKFEQYGKVKMFTTTQNYVDYGFVHPGG